MRIEDEFGWMELSVLTNHKVVDTGYRHTDIELSARINRNVYFAAIDVKINLERVQTEKE